MYNKIQKGTRNAVAYTDILLVNFFCTIIKTYQQTLSPDHGVFRMRSHHCRFYPTCSQYAIEAFHAHGFLRGALKAIKRLGRCNPFHAPGYDPVSIKRQYN